jgi:ketosteroid isomerase-like protein
MSTIHDGQVLEMVRNWSDAVSRGDRDAIRAHHAEDLLMYDFADTARGIEAYDRAWDFFFERQRGPITFAPSNMQATAGERTAFVTCDVHCDGTAAGPLDFRLTVCLERRKGNWVIAHEHHSLPTTDERFIDPSK